MLRFVKKIVWLLSLVVGCQSAFGFALVGPAPEAGSPDVFEVPQIGYLLGSLTGTGNIVDEIALYPGADIGTPKNIAEGFRRNTPVMYYAFDESFLTFFGVDGAAEVDKAMGIFNSLTNVSSYSADLSEFPLDSRRINFRAAADSLLDIKSVTMGLMIEQLGPWQPTRWVWALHARAGTPCPVGMGYGVMKRNFDIVPSGPEKYQNSSYVNGVLYSYFIAEFCSGVIPLADAIEFPVDPLSSPYSAVADFDSFWYRGLSLGTFYTSLTRDDAGGLRYLMRTNNFLPEAVGARTIEFVTNGVPQGIQTQDLGALAVAARTNDPVALAALFPGLIVTSTITNFFSLAITTNVTEVFVNFPTDPAGSLPSHPVFSTNYSTNILTTYQHTFGNIVTNSFATRGTIGIVTLSLQTAPFAPAGFIITTNGLLSLKLIPVNNGVFGDFFIIPTNLCGARVLSNVLTQVTITTNLPTTTVLTNGVTFTPGSITFTTNHFVAYLPVTCPVDAPGDFGGIERVRFIRRDYDPIVGQGWDPITNDYTIVELVTNNIKVLRHFQRAIPKPDFLFTATDLAVNTAFTYSNTVANARETLTVTITGLGNVDVVRTMNFDATHRPSNQAGPGTITTPLVLPTLMIYNKIGPLYFNSFIQGTLGATGFIDETTQIPFFDISWGSFDGSTNAPEVYPNGSTILELENLLNGPVINTRSLPNGNVGSPYFAQFAAGGGQPPFTWSLAPTSPSLPDGLNLSSDGKITGTPDGPASIYDFTVRVTDSVGAFKDLPFTITIF